MGAEGTCFVDTNVLVYARDASEPEKQPQAMAWLQCLWQREAGRISTQVLNEFYVVTTSKLRPGLSREEARRDVCNLFVWHPLGMSEAVMRKAWEIEGRHGYCWWDALVVASARFLGCRWLLSEDMQHEQTIGSLTIINPFRVRPTDIFRD